MTSSWTRASTPALNGLVPPPTSMIGASRATPSESISSTLIQVPERQPD
jgi:hypothetical protein